MGSEEPAPGARAQQIPVAIALGLASVALFSAMDGVGKHLLETDGALEVTWMRYLTALVFVLGIWWGEGRPAIRRDMWLPHAVRGIAITATTLTFFAALDLLQFAEVILLLFISPLLVPFLAAWMLKERLRPAALAALALGFCGVAVTALWDMREGVGVAPDRWLGILFALISALTYALSIILLRQRAGRDGASLVSLFAVAIPGLYLTGPVLLAGAWPTWSLWAWYGLFGLFGAAAGWCLARAYALAEAQMLAPLDYSALIWAGLIGWLVFAEVPGMGQWLALPLILGACVIAARIGRSSVTYAPAAGGVP